MKKILLVLLITATAFMLYADTINKIQGIGTYNFDKSDCYSGSKEKQFCAYSLIIESINWNRLRGSELQINVSLNCKGNQETIEKRVTRDDWEKGRIDNKRVFYCGDTDSEPSFVLRENLAEIAHHNPQASHGPKPGDWSKVKQKKEVIIITEGAHIEYEVAINYAREKAIKIANDKHDDYYAERLKAAEPYKVFKLHDEKLEPNVIHNLKVEWRVK